MTQEQKDLLLKDISARLPYGVKVLYEKQIYKISEVSICNETITIYGERGYPIEVELQKVKPYLFPLSSMTEEQKNDLTKNLHSNVFVKDEISFWCLFTANMMGEWKKVFEWCVKNHFDICGLIPMGLAINATELNIY